MESQKVKGKLSDFRSQNVRRVDGDDRQSVGFATLVDIIFVIDATGSMQNLIDEVKARALSMYQDIVAGLKAKRRRVTKLRIKILAFRDVYVDANPFEESEFFTLPEESEELKSFVENIRAVGGGDEPESSLEALCMALKAKFQENRQNRKARQIIVLLTDASAHRLDNPQRAGDQNYPADIPADLKGVETLWAEMDFHAKRLVVFAPNVWPWNEIGMWGGADYVPSQAGKGIDSETFQAVIEAIIGSV